MGVKKTKSWCLGVQDLPQSIKFHKYAYRRWLSHSRVLTLNLKTALLRCQHSVKEYRQINTCGICMFSMISDVIDFADIWTVTSTLTRFAARRAKVTKSWKIMWRTILTYMYSGNDKWGFNSCRTIDPCTDDVMLCLHVRLSLVATSDSGLRAP